MCLTVVESGTDTFTADVMRETLDRSCLGALVVGDPVNLERPMRLDGRLGGHLVQGHVDGTGTIESRDRSEHWEVVRVSLPADLARYVVHKGSITVDGVSLTVASVDDRLVHRQPDPDHPRAHHPRPQAGRRPGQPRGRRRRQVRRAAARTRPVRPVPGGPRMSVFTDLYEAHLTIGGHDITWREILGNAFGLASAVGGMRRKVWAWPVGIIGNVLLFTVFLFTATESDHGGSPLYGQAARQVFFVIVSVYGWWRWSTNQRSGAGAPAVVPRWATGRERVAYLAAAAVGVVACYYAFRAIGAGFPAEWWFYLADAWIFVGSIVATYAMARGWVDFWLCWIAVDLVGVPLLLHSHFYPSAVLYGVYGLFVIWGFVTWLKIARTEEARLGDAARRPDEVRA